MTAMSTGPAALRVGVFPYVALGIYRLFDPLTIFTLSEAKAESKGGVQGLTPVEFYF